MKTTLFGTDGIRALIGTPPFTHELFPQLAAHIAQWIARKKPSAHVLIGSDTRISRDWIKAHLITALLSHGIHVYDGQILSTPLICTLVMDKEQIYDFGIVISASHNPFHDNGIKLINKQGKISLQDEYDIEQLLASNPQSLPYNFVTEVHDVSHASIQIYKNHIRTFFPSNMLKGVKIVLDCAHGATSFIAPSLFEMFGASVVTINNHPTGFNINKECGSLHTESLAMCVQKENALCGFAFDGDGDRVIAVNNKGTVIHGDHLIALLSNHPSLENQQIIAITVMSNLGLIHYLKERGKTVITTPVGDKHILTALESHDLLLGGEQSGHIIMRDYSPSGDGIFTALRILETLLITKNRELECFQPWPQVIINIPVHTKIPLQDEPINSLIGSHTSQLCEGRLVVRYSGTENILRIMVEDKNETTARVISQSLASRLQGIINGSKELI